MNRSIPLPFLMILIFWGQSCFSQISENEKQTLASGIERLSSARNGAVCYLQSNKGVYETGEDLWFKAYLLDEKDLMPYAADTTLCVQLVPLSGGRPVIQEKIVLLGGFGSGHFFVPDSLKDGEYYLQAFSARSYMGQTEFKSLRKIIITKSIIPELRASYTFRKKDFSAGDSVKLELKLKVANSTVMERIGVEAHLERKGKILESVKTSSDYEGQLRLLFSPQDSLSDTRVHIQAFKAAEPLGSAIIIPVPHQPEKLYFDTFPEGGYLVSGLPGVLGFKATDEMGKPIEIRGMLLEDGKPIKTLATLHDGMGSIAFSPTANKQYMIKLDTPYRDSSYLLKNIRSEVPVMSFLGKAPRGYAFRLLQSEKSPATILYLRVQQRGKVINIAKIRLRDSMNLVLPATELAQGIAEVTLLGASMNPLAERLIYANPQRRLRITVDSLKAAIGTREKQKLMIRVSDEQGKPIVAHLGISVYDTLYNNKADAKHILTHYFLDNELAGQINNPAWYFDEQNTGREKAMDLLLLTQGWRRYIWTEENLKKDKVQQIIGNSIPGNISVHQRKKKLAGSFYNILFAPNNKDYKSFVLTDSSGNFMVSPSDLASSGNGYLYARVTAPEAAKVDIIFTEPFKQINESLGSRRLSYPEKYQHSVQTELPAFSLGGRAFRLKEVVIKARTSTKFRDKYIGYLDSIAKADMTSDYIEVFPADSATYRISNKQFTLNAPFARFQDRRKPIEGKTYNIVYYKGSAITEGNAVTVNGGRYIFDDWRSIVYHYPKFTEEELLKKYNLGRTKGYNIPREFYSPDYANPQTAQDTSLDNRNALYWKPDLITDANGEAVVEFYSSDISSGFTIVIEGTDGTGLLGRKVRQFNVKVK
jgi:hypothetical protein